MNRIAAGAVILLQLWMLSPLCCCWFQSARRADRSGDCRCGSDEADPIGRSPTPQDRDCRCDSNKIELPMRGVVVADAAVPIAWHAVPSTVPSSVIDRVAWSDPRLCHDLPPPATISERLAQLHRFLL